MPSFRPLRLQAREPREIGVGNDRARIVDRLENAGRAGAQHQLLCFQARADAGSDRVGVDVQQRAVVVRRDRAHDRHQAVVEQLLQHFHVDQVDVADEAVVDHLTLDADRRPLVSTHQARIDAADADCSDVELAADAEDLRVDQPVEHHAGDFHRLAVGDAPARDHARRQAERLLHLRELRTAAVHEYDADADLMQDRDLLDQPTRRGASPNTPPLALMTNTLPLYMWM